MISQKLVEAAGEAHSTCFEDIVPKPYQDFKDVFAKESFDELLDWKKWDHTIGLVPNAQTFSGLPGIFHQEEGQESLPCPRLLEAQCHVNKECLPPTPDP